ncbi:MAG: histidine kinase [Bacteroidia bacterium]
MMFEEAKSKNSRLFIVLLHLVVWSAFISFPILLLPTEAIEWQSLLFRHWIPLLFSALLFYLNYFFLIKSYLFKSKISIYLLINVILIIALLLGFEWIKDTANIFSAKSSPHKPFKTFFYFRVFISYLLPVGVSVAIKSTHRFLSSEIERKNRENESLKSELNYLHYQIQPHFFFNSLNTIYALIAEAPDRAQKALHQLSKLMRYVLYETAESRVDLYQEIDFLKNYIQLMQERQGHILKITTEFPYEIIDSQIAPLLFIPLVENAFKHSVIEEGETYINIKIQQEKDSVTCIVVNSCNPKDYSDKSGSGIGIINLKKRLNHQYPEKYKLTSNKDNGVYTTELIIQL